MSIFYKYLIKKTAAKNMYLTYLFTAVFWKISDYNFLPVSIS